MDTRNLLASRGSVGGNALGAFEMLGYYKAIAPPADSSFVAEFAEMELDDLISLTGTLEENDTQDIGQLETFVYANYYLFMRAHDIGRLGVAVEAMEALLGKVKPTDDPEMYGRLLRDCIVMILPFGALRFDTGYLEMAIFKAQELLGMTDWRHKDRFARWDGLCRMLSMYCNTTGDHSPLLEMEERANFARREAFDVLKIPFEMLKDLPVADKKSLFLKLKEGFPYISSDEGVRVSVVSRACSLGHYYLGETFSRDREILDDVIFFVETAIPYREDNGGPKAMDLGRLAQFLRTRCERFSKNLDDMDRSVKLFHQAIILDIDVELRTTLLSDLQETLLSRYSRTHHLYDIERGTRILHRLLEKEHVAEEKRRTLRGLLGRSIVSRFEDIEEKKPADLEELDVAIGVCKELADYAEAHPEELEGPDWYHTLANALKRRFVQLDDVDDLNMSIQFVNICGVIQGLSVRHGRFGNPADLDRLIKLGKDALNEIDPDSAYRPTVLNSLLSGLVTRLEMTGDDSLAYEGVRYAEEAVFSTDDHHPKKNVHLVNLCRWYLIRYKWTQDLESIELAIRTSEQALRISPAIDRMIPFIFSALAESHWARFMHDQILYRDDMDISIKHAQEALRRMPEREERTELKESLARFFFYKFDVNGSQSREDIDMATFYSRAAVTEANHDTDEAEQKVNLAKCLFWRSTVSRECSDLIEAIRVCKEALMDVNAASAQIRIRAALVGLDCLDQCQKLTEMANAHKANPMATPGFIVTIHGKGGTVFQPADLYRTVEDLEKNQINWMEEVADFTRQAVYLLPSLNSRAVQQGDQQTRAKEVAGLGTRAVAAALAVDRDVDRCLELSEFGRGVVNGLRFDTRADIGNLIKEHPDLSQRFIEIRDALEERETQAKGLTRTAAGRDVHRRHDLTRAFDIIVEEIRGKPGFENFLQATRAEDLKRVSASPNEAVVIINTNFRCDAIIIQNGQVRNLPLPELRGEDIARNVEVMRTIRMGITYGTHRSRLSRMLKWLWAAAVRPVLEDLGFTTTPAAGEAWPRVWWVPTGALTQLPLHAAGLHSSKGSPDSALNRVVSSYSSSVKALMYTRRHQKRRDPTQTGNEMLLVSMPTTPGASNLKGADEEISELQKMLSPTGKVVSLREPTKAELLSKLDNCAMFHFAGHGQSDLGDPSKSRLLLRDCTTNPFTAEDLMNMKLYEKSPWLAYLSACSTGESQDHALHDEAIHLISACQSAGFQNVVGTLWEVSDWHSKELARDVYASLIQSGLGKTGDVALALHNAVRRLRDATSSPSSKRGLGGGDVVMEDRWSEDSWSDEDMLDFRGSDGTLRNHRGAKFVGVKSKSTSFGDPLLWAAYIHVGL